MVRHCEDHTNGGDSRGCAGREQGAQTHTGARPSLVLGRELEQRSSNADSRRFSENIWSSFLLFSQKTRLRDDNSLAQVCPSSKQQIWYSRTCWLFSRPTLHPVAPVADLHELMPRAPLDLANGKHSRRREAGRREETGYLSSVHTGLALAVASFFDQGHGCCLSTSL